MNDQSVCVECGHNDVGELTGTCDFYSTNDDTRELFFCGCKCVFPVDSDTEVAYANHLRGCAQCARGPLCVTGRDLWANNGFQPAYIPAAEIGSEVEAKDDGSALWCDDCHGYEHTLDCPAYKSKVEAKAAKTVCAQCESNARDNEAGGYYNLAKECREYCRRGHRSVDSVEAKAELENALPPVEEWIECAQCGKKRALSSLASRDTFVCRYCLSTED